MLNPAQGIHHVSLTQGLSKGPPPAGNLALPIFSHGSVTVELYSPKGEDLQKPHSQDELYFVARGTGSFYDGARQHSIQAGSFLFVPAGQVHRFEAFSSDFAVWVVFYGPQGGEPVG
jgi:mannose-6-phosphate isomerase-like protein (cupin superfamily)